MSRGCLSIGLCLLPEIEFFWVFWLSIPAYQMIANYGHFIICPDAVDCLGSQLDDSFVDLSWGLLGIAVRWCLRMALFTCLES